MPSYSKANSVKLDKEKVDALIKQKGLSMRGLSLDCGRSGNYLESALRRGQNIHKNTAKLLAKLIGCEYDDIIVKDKPKVEVQEPAAQQMTGSPELLRAIETLTEVVKSIDNDSSRCLANIAIILTRIADAVERRAEEDSPIKENVQAAKEIIKTLTEATGEAKADKYNRSCDMRGISRKERLVALDESNCQYQWRAGKNGDKCCYVVRGC